MAKYYVNVNTNGTFWYKDEAMKIPHREHGPAIVWASGTKSWWINGQRHREDGPAVEHHTGDVQYWLNNQHLTEEQWEAAVRPVEEMTIAQIEQLLGKRIKVVK